METWKPVTVEGFSNYEVSNLGRVRRSASGAAGTYAGRVMKPASNHYGRMVVNLTGDSGRQKVFYVHHLVALAFIGEPPGPIGSKRGTFQINHLDGDPTNNRVANLEWTTPQGNIRHAVKNGLHRALRGEAAGAHLTESNVLEVRDRFRNGEDSSAMAAEFGVSRGCMMAAIHGRTWKHLPGSCRAGDKLLVLTKEMVLEARRRAEAGEPVKHIATSFGVNYYTLWRAVSGRNWKHL